MTTISLATPIRIAAPLGRLLGLLRGMLGRSAPTGDEQHATPPENLAHPPSARAIRHMRNARNGGV
jgi:hypothetical protein